MAFANLKLGKDIESSFEFLKTQSNNNELSSEMKNICFTGISEYYARKSLFEEGYNCAQSVFLAFEDLYEIDRKTALCMSSSFGGGMGRLREVCGAVSGMFMVAGILYGYDDPKASAEKRTLSLLS